MKKYFWATAFFVLFDQITKIYIKGFNFLGIEHEGMMLGESHEVIPDFLSITYVLNPGMAFGIEFGWGKIFLSLFSVIASLGLIWLLKKLKNHSTWIKIGIMLILSGAMGNLIDRVFYGVLWGEDPLFYGKVVDFIQVNIPDIDFWVFDYTHWPVFNIADACVSVGVVFLLLFHKKLPTWEELKK